jgi:purine-binding chemotaxis protein CheW
MSDLRLVCFRLGHQRFGAPIEQVKETIVLRPITKVFLMPPWVAGILNLRGDVVAVLDLGRFLGLSPARLGPETRVVIARGAGRTAGLLVDQLDDVRTIAEDRLATVPGTLAPEHAALSRGVCTLDDGAPLAVLDLVELLNTDRLARFQRRA